MRNVILVVGAPCAGKTTWVRQHASDGDLIIDWDVLAQQAGSPYEHDHPEEYARQATTTRKRLEARAAAMEHGTAFIIRTLPNPRDRTDAAWRLQATSIKVIDPGEAVCIQRANTAGRTADTIKAIREWYRPHNKAHPVG